MLRELIRMIREGRGYSQAELARQLGVSEGLVTQMLEDLRRMGYLKHAEEAQSGGCAACPLTGMCFSRTYTAAVDRGRV